MKSIPIVTGLLILSSPLMRGEVIDSTAAGFNIKVETAIEAPVPEVYRKLVHNVGQWWSPDHTYSLDAHNLSIDDRPMGCFCEKLPNGGGVLHLEVLTVMPEKELVFSGPLGPLRNVAATGNMRITFEPQGSGTKLTLTYAVVGYLAKGMNTFAAPVDRVLTDQIARLKNYVERGDPATKAK